MSDNTDLVAIAEGCLQWVRSRMRLRAYHKRSVAAAVPVLRQRIDAGLV